LDAGASTLNAAAHPSLLRCSQTWTAECDHDVKIGNWILVGLVLAGLPFNAGLAAESGRVDFNRHIRPLLSDRCYTCHGPDEKARKKTLRLDTRDGLFKALEHGWAVVTPGDPSRSELVRRILAEDADDLMPPPESKLSLSPVERDLIERWVTQGAEFKPHWSFIPVETVMPPQVANPDWVRNPIDAFVLAQLASEQLSPAPEAAPETLLRRLALNLTGLPPTVAELDSFLADQSPGARARAVERYLISPAYGERMAMDWLDLARYADTYGYQADMDRDMSPWRDWVIQAFNDNLPYDQFLLWQLAGDLLPNATREQRLATAFNRLHRQTNEGGSIDEEFRAEYVADRVNTVGTAMLGLTLECARCHDHKFDPLRQHDYYALSAFFNSIDEAGLYAHYTRAVPTPTLLLRSGKQDIEAASLKTRIAAAERELETIQRDAEDAFQAWLKIDGQYIEPRPVAHFPFDNVASNTTPDRVNPTNFAKLVDEPKLVPGATGHTADFALLFSGDNEVVCTTVPNFRRTDPFSLSLRLKPAETQNRAVVLHQSRAWSDSGSRGFELVLDQGRPFFGLIHFWPGNALAVRAKEPLPTRDWSHLTVTSDGSSRAAGVRLYLNGTQLETEVVRDHLYKDIVHRREWGDADAGKISLTLGGRFRDSGFKNGAVDDLRVFDLCLTAPEVEWVARAAPGRRALGGEGSRESAPSPATDSAAENPAARLYFLARHHEPYRAALAGLRALRQQENDLVNDIPEIMVMQEMPDPRATFLLERGAYDAPGQPVTRDTPASILPFLKDQPRNRLGLARWLIDRGNPLTARVIVNRIWRMHFGRGLVVTEQDFGSQGALPTHPELLDWMAGWFMDNGWDVKGLHRLILASATFQQSSRAPREIGERDPDNLWLARGPKHRLQAEQIRDGALAASGLLNSAIGGSSVKPYQPPGLWEQSGTGKTYTQDQGWKLYRRSLYTFWRRTAPPPSMLAFDAVTREVCTAKRETTATPLQALVLLNDPQFVEAARALGERLLKEHPTDAAARVRQAFRSLIGRAPDEKEAALLMQLFEEQKRFYAKNNAAAERILATGESKWDRSLRLDEFAATAMLVSAVMNFDEFVMKR